MRCPYCGHSEDRVLDTRVQREGEAIRRRRECLECNGRFTTVETLLQVYPLIVKKDGRREPFAKDKVLRGIQAACQKRAVSLAQMEQIVDRVARWVLSRSEREIPARWIGEKVVKELRLLDNVAYVRFASVYRDFKDVHEFVSKLEQDPDSFEALNEFDENGELLKLTPPS
jgi:transcriptional repressor NrdR